MPKKTYVWFLLIIKLIFVRNYIRMISSDNQNHFCSKLHVEFFTSRSQSIISCRRRLICIIYVKFLVLGTWHRFWLLQKINSTFLETYRLHFFLRNNRVFCTCKQSALYRMLFSIPCSRCVMPEFTKIEILHTFSFFERIFRKWWLNFCHHVLTRQFPTSKWLFEKISWNIFLAPDELLCQNFHITNFW